MNDQSPAEALRQTRALDTIQRKIWARQNEEAEKRGIKLSIGDCYALGSVIKEVLHDEVTAYAATVEREADTKARLDELKSIREEHQAEGIKRYMYEIVDERLAALQGPQDGDGK
jgi:predicted LPLAT superfamily acyltransferase